MKYFFHFFIVFAFISPLFSQNIENKNDFEFVIKKMIIKNTFISGAIPNKSWFLNDQGFFDPTTFLMHWSKSTLRFPGFGFPGDLDCEITPIERIVYPDENYKLYKFSVKPTPENAWLASWDNGFQLLYLNPNQLVAIDENLNVKFVSGTYICHEISKDFNLKRNKPESYLPFLKLVLYVYQLDEIAFLKKKAKNLIFIGTRFRDNAKLEITINPELPDRYKIKNLKEKPGPYVKSPVITSLPFKDFEDKKRYILYTLTKNYFFYQICNVPDLHDRLGIDTSTMFYKNDVVPLDSFIPDYNLFFYGMDIATINRQFAKEHCGKSWAPFQRLLTDERDQHFLGNSIHPDIEFYRIYKDTIDQVKKRLPDGKIAYADFFDFYNPDLKKKHEAYYKKTGHPHPPVEPMPAIYPAGGASTPCAPYNLPFPEDWKSHIDYYLVALDTKNREVYFISGRDIFLSNATHLYSPISKEPPADIKKWKLPTTLAYIKDRLYRYQVAFLGPENIILNDPEKMVLTAEGTERGKPISLKITFFFNRPELLDIEIINR